MGSAASNRSAADFLPSSTSLPALEEAAAGCQGCDLHRTATQTVFGQGSPDADVMLVGEQPGDREDLEGRPFVGPAGKVLDRALADAGIERDRTYVTNVVKHFKWTQAPRGKRRIHRKPDLAEVMACRPWLDAELARVQPKVLVLLGATAAQALLDRSFKVTKDRGRPVESSLAPVVMATVHPSSILRARDDETRTREREAFTDDLRQVAKMLAGLRSR